MAANYGKKFHTPTHLVCIAHRIANFLSFHMRLVVVMNYGAGNALRDCEIGIFILYTYPKIYCCCEYKKLWNNVNDSFPESCYVKDYENAKLVNLPS